MTVAKARQILNTTPITRNWQNAWDLLQVQDDNVQEAVNTMLAYLWEIE